MLICLLEPSLASLLILSHPLVPSFIHSLSQLPLFSFIRPLTHSSPLFCYLLTALIHTLHHSVALTLLSQWTQQKHLPVTIQSLLSTQDTSEICFAPHKVSFRAPVLLPEL